MRRLAILAVPLFALVFALLTPAHARAQTTPADPLFAAPGIAPPLSNVDCTPAAEHPVPVILVHGTLADMTVSWNLFAPALAVRGYCVYALDLVRRGTAPIDESADKLAAFIDDVRARTGAGRVSLIGHSQGGMIIRYVARHRGKGTVIDDAIGLAPSHHGTDVPLAAALAPFCVACGEQVAGSPFMQKLNAGPDEAPAPVSYTVVASRYDEVVIPYQSQALRAGPNVTNVVLQDACPADPVEHVGMIYDPVALQWAIDALGRPGPAAPDLKPNCVGMEPETTPPARETASTTTSAGAPPTAATLRFLNSSRALRYRRGAVRVPVRCSGPERSVCAGRVELRTGTASGRLLARRPFKVHSGRATALVIRLSRAAKARLRTRSSRAAFRVTVRANVGTTWVQRRYLVRP